MIEDRLKKIKYQIRRRDKGSFTDTELVESARSLYDAAINADTIITEPELLPTEVFGVAMEWNVTGKIASFTKNAIIIEDDDLTDDVQPNVAFGENAFTIDGEAFMLSDGNNLEIRIA